MANLMMVCFFPWLELQGGIVGKIALKSVASAAALALSLVLSSSAAYAAGLGRLNVFSALGEPLKAEIEILALQPSEVDSLAARLASNVAYKQANIDLNGALLGVKFAVERRSSGQYVISLTSAQAMNEPFIDMLVELSWATGRLVREYTFVLDPPEYRGPAAISVPAIEPTGVAQPFSAVSPPPKAEAPASAPAATAPAPVPAAKPVAKPAAPAAAAPVPAKEAAKSAGTYTVKRGDTLARIAQQNRAEGVSLQQMLVSLYKGNPDAFDGENMNRLRAGRILNLPDREAAAVTTEADATRMVNAQRNDYAKYRSSLGAAVAAAPAREEGGRQAAGKISAPEQDKPAAKEAAKDQLRLSRPEEGKAGGKGGAAASKDDMVAKERALKEANERIALLEKNIAAMKSQSGAQLQQQAAKGDAAKAASKPEAAKPEPIKPEAPKPAASKAEAPKPEAAKPEAAKPAAEEAKPVAPVPEAPKAPDAPKAAPKPVAPPPPPPAPASFVDELLEDPMQMGLIGLVGALLGGYAFYAVRRKRKAAASSSIAATEPTFGSSVLAAPGGASIDTDAGDPFIDSGSADAVPAESEEIDAVAEADVYMAYGRDAQAEEILKDALGKTPERHAIRLKLLELYAHRKDSASFEATARDLQSATGGEGADWEKAVALGQTLDPDNALYSAGSPAGHDQTVILSADDVAMATAPDLVLDDTPADTPAAGAAPDIDFDLDLGAPATDAAPGPAVEQPATSNIDFDLDLGAPATDSAPALAADEQPASGIDFDLDLGSDQTAVQPEVLPEMPAAADAGDALSIDFELPGMTMTDAPVAVPVIEAPAAEDGLLSIDFDLGLPETSAVEEQQAPALDLSGISLDLDSPGGSDGSQSAQWQEVATKLDLAKAYQDMGDKDGARELLNEVVTEGDATQQDQARTMLDALG